MSKRKIVLGIMGLILFSLQALTLNGQTIPDLKTYPIRPDPPARNNNINSKNYNSTISQPSQADLAETAKAKIDADNKIKADLLAAEKLKKEKDAEFIRDRDAAARTLKGSSGNAMSQLKGLSGTGSYGLKGSGSGFDSGSQLKSESGTSVVDVRNEPARLGGKSDFKGAFATPNHTNPASVSPTGDPNVVDARNVPSELPNALDNAIASVYSSAPYGVSDRVRKGFQAVMNHDWAVAKAWFEDALNRDPDNVGLKRLVALVGPFQQPNLQTTNSDKPFTNEPIPPNSDRRTFAETSLKIHSHEAWMKFLFPDPKESDIIVPVFKTLPNGKIVQLPQDSDMEFLFETSVPPPSSKTGKIK